ncbi:hypothetical protein IVA80_15330 [Bradyrhizobium sp. 139]|uniref:hypothetical protein n=1 Tax=Bradyrhizobium sp. 139 TaxID=2782616 RepID=UPI001FFA5613|nr:hypothetical protein [Bradyrhizobium sp. 139]MCK1742196.1 hypothetical protein [Bradyrhizobium sp. 139]
MTDEMKDHIETELAGQIEIPFGRENLVPFKPKVVVDNTVTSEGNPGVTSKYPPANPMIVATLEGYVEMAKAGQLQFVALAYVDHKGHGFSAWSPTNDQIETPLLTSALGAVAFLNARFLDAALDGAIDEDGPDAPDTEAARV